MSVEHWDESRDEGLERLLIEASKFDDVCRYFKYMHLPEGPLRDMSRTLALTAYEVITRAPRCPQRTHALNHLLLAKDAAVRACLP